jgi:putative hydrolase of the HAD superfamily
MNHIKGVFFDLHGTLLLSDDVDASWENWVHEFHSRMRSKGVDVTLTDFKEHLDMLFNAPEPEYEEQGMTLFMRRVKALGTQLGVELSKDEIRPLVDSIIKVWHRGMYLDEEAKRVLQILKPRYKVGLITNWEHTPRIFELLKELEIDRLFDTVIVSDEFGAAKPEAEIFYEALRQTDVNPNEAVYVGDMDVDVVGSINAGIHPVLIKRQVQGNWASYSYDEGSRHNGEQVTQIKRLSDLLILLGLE